MISPTKFREEPLLGFQGEHSLPLKQIHAAIGIEHKALRHNESMIFAFIEASRDMPAYNVEEIETSSLSVWARVAGVGTWRPWHIGENYRCRLRVTAGNDLPSNQSDFNITFSNAGPHGCHFALTKIADAS